jgi:hypothetical protein
VAFAGRLLQARAIEDGDPPTLIPDYSGSLQRLCDAGDIGPLDAEHFGQEFLRQEHFVVADAVMRRQQPARSALLDRVESVARDGLQKLRDEAVRISGEEIGERLRTLLGGVELGNIEP